jgi:polyhydroxyalkanoate synthesis regulator phasin
MAILGTYNYTIYVPENMTLAFNNGLGNWDKVKDIYEHWEDHKAEYGYNTEDEAKAFVKDMINNMRSFVLYHIQNNSVYKDDNINTSSNETFYTNNLGIAKSLSLIAAGSDVYVKDAVEGRSTTDYPKMTSNSNILVRDLSVSDEQTGYDDNNSPFTYKEITSSSFVVIHGIDKPLCYNSTFKY